MNDLRSLVGKEKLKVAVIGLGVGEQHAAAFQALTECSVVAVCDTSEEKLQAVGAKFPTARLLREAGDIFQDPEIDIVSVASYDDAHFSHVIQALEAGKHVFVEKPLCQTSDQLLSIKNAWARHQGRVKLASNLVLRAAPVFRWLRDQVAEGKMGEVYSFDGDYLYGRLHKITEGWRKNVRDYSVMEGGGIHLIDLLLWICGERPETVTASGNRICTRGTAFRYNDYVTTTLECPSGMLGRITANFGCVHPHQHVLRVFGTKATFIHDDAGPRMQAARDPAPPAAPVALAALPPTKGALIPNFVSAIVRDEDTTADTQSVFDGISLCLACDKALQSHACEKVHYV